MITLARSALLVLWAGVAACEDRAPVDGTAELVQSDVKLPAALLSDPRLKLSHRGTRRIEYQQGTGLQAAFRERIATDGHGNYSIEPLEALESSINDWDTFALVQRAREGFVFRYRDFVVRDAELFVRNWVMSDEGSTESVAGRTCQHLHVERRRGPDVSYDLWTDVATGLVLASRELAEGLVIASMTYESVEFDPDHADVVWHRPVNEERSLDATVSLALQLDTHVLEPRLIPDDYALRQASTVQDDAEGRWLKLTYVDGIEPLFFLQRLPVVLDGTLPMVQEHEVDVEPEASSVQAFEMGPVRVVQGTVEGRDLMVIGRPEQAELLDMIESALP